MSKVSSWKDKWLVFERTDTNGKMVYYIGRWQMDVPAGSREVDHFLACGRFDAMRQGSEIVNRLRSKEKNAAQLLLTEKKEDDSTGWSRKEMDECEDCNKRIRCFKHCSIRGSI